jgi:hypothetical protein
MTRDRVAAAVACGLEAAVVTYTLLRVAQAILTKEPNPALVMATVHSGYFWRLWIAGYAGGFIALLTLLVVRSSDRLFHLATRSLPFAGALIVLQGLLLP